MIAHERDCQIEYAADRAEPISPCTCEPMWMGRDDSGVPLLMLAIVILMLL